MKKGFLIKTGVCAMSAVMLLGGIAGCQRRDAVQTTAASTISSEAANTTVRPICETAGQTFLEGILSMNYGQAVLVIDYESNKDAESKLYEFYDSISREIWSYDFFTSRLKDSQFVASNFVYDTAAGTAKIDYRITIPDYTGTTADGGLKYFITLNFKYDVTAGTALVTNPTDVIDGFYRVAERDYVNYIIKNSDTAFLTPTPAESEQLPTETTTTTTTAPSTTTVPPEATASETFKTPGEDANFDPGDDQI